MVGIGVKDGDIVRVEFEIGSVINGAHAVSNIAITNPKEINRVFKRTLQFFMVNFLYGRESKILALEASGHAF